MVSQVEIGARFDVSDHHEIRFKINAKEVEQNTAFVPDFRKANYQGLRYHLQIIHWGRIGVGRWEDQNNEVEMHYNSIVRKIHTGKEQYIPKRIRSNRNDPKWMNSSIRREIGLKRVLYRRIKSGEAQVIGQYNDLAGKVKKDTRTARRNYEVKIASDAQKDPKRFYQLYKNKTKNRIGPLKGTDGSPIDNSEEISKELNNYFLSVFSQEVR